MKEPCVIDEFEALYAEIINRTLGSRGRGYSHSEVFSAVAGVFFSGGDHIEDLTTGIGNDLRQRPGSRVPSSDTVCRALKSLSEENVSYTADSGNRYEHNIADRLNGLMLDMLLKSGQLVPGQRVTLDFDHQFLPAEKYDAKMSYKCSRGYFPGVATVGGMIVGVENRDGNSNVRFRQEETLERIFTRLEQREIHVDTFRADCGSFGEDILDMVAAHCPHFFIRAASSKTRRAEYSQHDDWRPTEVNCQKIEVASFRFNGKVPRDNLRLVVQRVEDLREGPNLFGKAYIYRAILTDRWDMSEEQVIEFYNKRGSSERNFDEQNNSFGWAHLPFSFMSENTVFLLVTTMLKNFFLYILAKVMAAKFPALEAGSRMKRFIHAFVCVPGKWVRTGRRWILNLYTRKPYDRVFTTVKT